MWIISMQYKLELAYKVILLKLFLSKISAVNPACECVIMRKSSFRENGLFNSPNYPSPYPPLINCILYTFIGFSEDIVELHFTDFNTQSPVTNRCSDYLKFFLDLKKPEVNERDEWNYEICGNLSMISKRHYSSTPFLIFEFHTDNIHTNHSGFKGMFRFYKKSEFETSTSVRWGSTCIYDFKSSNLLQKGKFFSPSYPQNYLPNSRCLYNFHGKSDERVALLFDEIELEEDGTKCEDSSDQIIVRDGIDHLSPISARFCGMRKTERVISSYNTALVEFKSDSRRQRKGFSASFKFFTAFPSHAKDATSHIFNFHSKHYAKQVVVETRNMSVIGESWKQDREFELQESLIARDFPIESNSMNGEKRFTFQPVHNKSLITTSFIPSHKITPKCNHTYTSTISKSGYFTSPGYSTSSSPNICLYTFKGNENEKVQIIFIDFDLSGPEEQIDPHECEDFDILTVSVNIKGENRNLINQCGHSVPHQLMSHDNRMEIIFASKQRDDRKTKGFKAIYNFVTDFGISGGLQDVDLECGFTYRSEISINGTFTSPNFPGLYPRNTECHYLFYGKQSESIFITFKTFDVEGIPPACDVDTQSDYVEFSNFNVKLIDRKMSRICGTKREQIRKPVRSDGNFFRVTFKSNDVYDSTGFEAFYQFKRKEDPLAIKTQKSRANSPVNWQYVYEDTLHAIAIILFMFNQICSCETSN